MPRYGTFRYGTARYGAGIAVATPLASRLSVAAPHCTVTIGGIVQDLVFEWHTDLERDQIATADVTLPVPTGAEVVEGALVAIEAATDAGEAERRVFTGTVTGIETGLSGDGRTARLACSGMAWALTLPLEADLAFAGGAPIDARLLSASVLHIGNSTVSWFADPSPDGLTVDLTFTPRVDARFVTVTGRQHGANSYREEPDRDIADFSRAELWQGGRRLGYANLPKSDERWRDAPDYTDDANWEDFSLTIGASIDGDGGDVTIRFVSGRKPGSKERDDYEVKGVTYQTAGRATVKDLARAVLRHRGYGPNRNGIPYRVANVLDLSGNPVELGGNGLIANGRVVLAEKTSPWDWLTQTANLFGYSLVDGPNAVDLLPLRGDPGSRTPQMTYTAGDTCFSVTRTRDTGTVTTDWRVYGASGTDEQGEPFQYQSFSDPAALAVPAWLPASTGAIAGEVRSDLLVSDKLARAVRQVAEQEHEAIPVAFELEVPPSPRVKPGFAVWVTAPDEGIDRLMWVTAVRHDWSDQGFWSSVSVQVASGHANPEEDPATAPRTQTDPALVSHVGNRTIDWYAVSDADGLSVTYPWHPGGAFRAVQVTGRYHGANAFKSGSKPETPSAVEVWQLGVRIGSAPLPWHPERFDARQDYGNDAYWDDFDLVIAADVVDASAEIRFSSGTARDGSRDEFEVKGVQVALYAEATEAGPVPTSGADWHAYEPKRVFRWTA